MIGLEAAPTLLVSNYKLQLLASSYYFDAKVDDEFYYGPNALFQIVKQVHRLSCKFQPESGRNLVPT